MPKSELRLETGNAVLSVTSDGVFYKASDTAVPEKLDITVILLVAPLIIQLLKDLDILKGAKWEVILNTILQILNAIGLKEE